MARWRVVLGARVNLPVRVSLFRDALVMPVRGKTAGASSQRKYDELTRSWRRRHRRLFVVLALVCLVACVGSFYGAQSWPSQGWLFGVFAGCALTFFVIVWLTPPGWIENWQSGAWGEQATAKALRALEHDGWVVLHDLDAGRGNVDHIAVGPGGVYLLDSKRLGGSVTVDGGNVTVRRLDDPDLSYQHPGSGHLLSLARQTHQRVLASSRLNTWVTPVMVVWAEFPQRFVEDRCVYVHGEELAAWLRSRPPRISPGRVRQVADAVATAWAAEAESTPA